MLRRPPITTHFPNTTQFRSFFFCEKYKATSALSMSLTTKWWEMGLDTKKTMHKFHDNWEIVVEGYIRQHLKKYHLYHNLPNEIREWLWLFADNLTTEEKHKLSIVLIGDYEQFINTMPKQFETHSYEYSIKQWKYFLHDSLHILQNKIDAIIIIIEMNTDKHMLQQTYTNWIAVLHHIGIKQIVFCITTNDKHNINEIKYNNIKYEMSKILNVNVNKFKMNRSSSGKEHKDMSKTIQSQNSVVG
eukprot:48426_1